MNHFIVIAILIVQPMLSIAASPDLNTQQVFNISELPSDVEVFFNYTFKMMVQKYAYGYLTKCHSNESMHYDYFLQYYSDVCPKEHYYCLDKPNDNTIHICGKADKCDKRKRNIVVIILNDLNHVHVYSISCPPGYAQVNEVNCFSPCVKDDSIIVRATAETGGKGALARCHAEKGYCNANRKTYFEIGSSEDECVVADKDLGIRCEMGEVLMIDCSCIKSYESTKENDSNDSLQCTPKEENVVTITNHTLSATNTRIKFYTENTPTNDSSVSANEENSVAIRINYKKTGFVVIAVIAVLGFLCYLYRKKGKEVVAVIAVLAIARYFKGKKGKEGSPRQDPEAQGILNSDSPSRNMNRVPPEGTDNMTNTYSTNEQTLDDPQLELLKSHDELSRDSGVQTCDETAVKSIY